MKFGSLAVALALCASVEGFHSHNAALLRAPETTLTKLDALLRYGLTDDGEDTTMEHGFGCPCCLTPEFFSNMSPREARIETPLKTMMASSLIGAISPGTASAYGKSFETSLNQYFPLSLPTSMMIQKVVTTLGKRNFNRSNTLFGSSVCPDEINSKPSKSLAAQFQASLTDQNGVFTLGGLGGIPFVGISGMGAFLSHTPTNGKVVIMYGPHVGISDDGQVGKVERLSKDKLSGSCGAGLGAYKAIYAEIKAAEEEKVKAAAEGKPPPPPPPAPKPKKLSVMDNQEEYIIRRLKPKLTTPAALAVSSAAMPAFVTTRMYDLVRELLMELMKAYWSGSGAWDSVDEIVLLGGIVVNRGQFSGSIESREDFFQPLVFDSYTKPSGGGQPVPTDLFPETFGVKADSWFD